MSHGRFARIVIHSTGHQTDPAELEPMLKEFILGQCIIKHGSGRDALLYSGVIKSLHLPDKNSRIITIDIPHLFQRKIGCEVNPDIDKVRWVEIDSPPSGLIMEFDWFRRSQEHERLKLASEHSGDKCWLCSSKDPIVIEIFRTGILKMFLMESRRKEENLLKRLRRRLF